MLNRVPSPFVISAGTNSVSNGTLIFSNSNNVSFGLNGSTLTGSASLAQSTQSAIKGLGASNTGNTAGNTGISTGIDWVFAGTNNITISESTVGGGPNTLWFSGPSVGGAQTGISGIVVSNTTYTSGTVSFSNAGNITISSSVNGATQFIRLSGNAAQTTQPAVNAFGVTNTGATAGNTGTSSGITWVLAGSNLLTLSQSTAGGGPNTVWIQHPAWLTTARSSNDAIGLNTAQTNVTWTVNSSGLSLNAGGYAGTGLTTTTTAGTVIVGTHNTSGLSLGIPAFLTTADLSQNSSKYIQNWKLTGNTSGTTSSAQGTDLWFSGGNSLTISGNSNTIVFSIGNYLTTADLSQNSSNYVRNWKLTGNTAGTTSSQQGTDLWLSGGANITLSGSSNSIIVVGGAGGGGGSFSAGASNLGNTAGNTGITGTQLVLVGTGVVSLSQTTGVNGGTLSIAVPATSSLSATGLVSISTNGSTISIGAAGINYFGVTSTGNTAGNTGTSSGIGFVIAGSNNITVSQSTTAGGPNTVWLSGAAGAVDTLSLYAVSNTFGTSSGTAAGSLSLVGSGAVSVAASDSGWVISAPQQVTLSHYEILGDMQPQAMVTNATLGQNSLYFVPFDLQAPLNAYRMNLFLSLATTVSAGNSTGRGGYSLSAALYSQGTGASTDRINSFWTGSAGFAMTMNSNTVLVITNVIGISNSTQVSSVGTSISSSNATTYPANSMGGFRALALPISSTLTPGRYWLAIANSSSSSNAGACILNASVMQMSMSNFLAFRPFGTSSAASNASFYAYMPGAGTYSLSSGGFPATIPLTSDSIRMSQTLVIPYVNFSGYTTGTNLL